MCSPGLLMSSSFPDFLLERVCRCRKILRARLWPSEDGSKAWDRSVVDIGGEVLLVSQFTLYGRLNGNRLDFSQALRPQQVTTQRSQQWLADLPWPHNLELPTTHVLKC